MVIHRDAYIIEKHIFRTQKHRKLPPRRMRRRFAGPNRQQDRTENVRFMTADYPERAAIPTIDASPARLPMDLILTFHSLDTSGSVISYCPDQFRQVVEGLLEEGVALVSMDEMLKGKDPNNRPRALLTFDDGFRSVHEHALPLLAELGVPALLYVVTGWVGRTNRWPTQGADAPELDLMDWSQLRELQAAGFELGSHTVEHPHLAELTEENLERELASSKGQLEDKLQQTVRHFSYPYGTYKPSTTVAVRKHYSTATTTDMRWLGASDDPLLLPRVDAYYLRGPERWAPIFGARTRTYLKGRAALRHIAGHLRR